MGQLQESLSTHFQSAGRLTRGEIPFPKLDDLTTSELAGEVESVYRSLGGKLTSLPLNLRKWDIEFDGVAVELDEHLHFNRYRGATLSSPAYEHLSGFPRELYLDYCASHEADCLKAGSYGGKWTNNSCEKQFGCSSTAGTLSGEGGAARWKQRAYYDFVKDLSPILIRTRVVRLAIWDWIDEKGEKRLLIDALRKPTECTTDSIINLFRLRSA